MTRRVGRSFDILSEAQLKAGRTAARRVAPQALGPTVGPTDGPRPIAQLLDTIQHVAEAATGERSFLHVPPARNG